MFGIANNAMFLIISAPNPGSTDPHFSHGATSKDGGATWTWGLFSDDSGWQTAGRAPVAWDTAHQVYVTCSNGHTYTSPDGLAWTDLGQNIPPNAVIGGCSYDGNVLMALSEASGTNNLNFSYWQSSNGGTTWNQNSAMLPNYTDAATFLAGDTQSVVPQRTLRITSGPSQIQNDTQPNVIAGLPFMVTVNAVKQDGSVDTSYSGATVTVHADDGAGHYPYSIGSGPFVNGAATVLCTTLTVVYGNRGYRSLQARDTDGLTGPQFNVAVYFMVWMDVEACHACRCQTVMGAYCDSPTFCDGTTLPPNSQFIALPYRSRGICGLGINFTINPTGPVIATTVRDIGPTTNNNYWNTGNYNVNPRNPLGCFSDGLANALGVPHGCVPDPSRPGCELPYGGAIVFWRFAQ